MAFFTLALFFSWPVWFSAPVLSGDDPYVLDQWVALGAFGPALSAIAISTWLYPGREKSRPGQRAGVFFVLWAIFTLILCAGKGPSFPKWIG